MTERSENKLRNGRMLCIFLYKYSTGLRNLIFVFTFYNHCKSATDVKFIDSRVTIKRTQLIYKKELYKNIYLNAMKENFVLSFIMHVIKSTRSFYIYLT